MKKIFASILCALSVPAAGQGVGMQSPMLDPWVPPHVREKARSEQEQAPSSGAALRAQVERKLRARFDAAAGPSGLLDRASAQAAGLGAVARDFHLIDRRATGWIRFEDYKAFLKAQGAALD